MARRYLSQGQSLGHVRRRRWVFVVSETTVKTHVARILMKLDLRDRVQAVVFASETGIIRTGRGASA